MSNEGDPPQPQQQQPESQEVQAPAAPEPGRAEGSASFLRAARAGDLEKVLELLRAGTDINTSNANGLNSLHLASKEGHSEVVRELIKRQAQVDAATRKGNTALHIASLAGQSLIVTILVENGANVNVQSVNGFTPLYMAAQENHEEVVKYLLKHGANQALSTEDGFTPLAVALQQGHDRVVAVLLENDSKGKVRLPALHIAAKKDDTTAATLLLQNEHNPDVTSKSGFTPLHIAAHYGHENVGQLLLEKGANVNYQARHNISPLHVATKWGRTNMANLLLSRGAIIDSRTKDLLTPLHCAARSGHDQVVDLLVVQGAPISAKTKNGLAPLHMAAQGDHVDAARTLLYHRAPVDDVTVDYLTPLHVAAHCGHVRVAKLLLDRSADPNSRALNGFTPLHIACKKNRIKVVELLLKYRAAIEATTESGLTPLHVAAFMGAINIVIYLLQQGANPDVETVRGETPLHLAARANQTDVVRVLIRNGAKVDAQARELQTPLHIASRLGNTDIVILLLQAGANSNATTRDNYSPLHIAAKEGQEEVAGILLDHNADKTLLTKKGFTPLHLASKYGNLEVVRLLLERGTPVDIEGKNQVTPLHVAAHYNNDKVAMLLLENGASAKAAAKNGYTPLHIAAKKNQMEIASTLLQFKADPNAKSRAGFTPLHLSAQEGHKEISGLLIENGSDVGAKANNGLTAMHLCAQEDHVPVAQILYNNGAEINSKTNAGYTPLHVACHFGQLNMVKFLVENGADVGEKTRASYTPLHQAAQQGHNNCVRYLLENGASPNEQTATGQTPLSIAQRLGYVSVVETLRTVTETTVITETTTVDERYKPQNPEAMNETMFSESEDEGQAAEHEAVAAHEKDFSDNLTQGLQDSTGVHMIHTGEQLLQRSQELENGGAIPKINSGGMSPEKEFAKIAPVATSSPIATSNSQSFGIAPRAGSISGQFQQQPLHGAGPEDNLEELVRRAQNHPINAGNYDNGGVAMLENGHADNVPIGHHVTQPSFLISFLVDARGGAMRGCRHSGVRIIVPPRKASQPIRVTCRYLRKDKLAHPPPLSEGEELASRILEMAPAGAKFLGPVILEVPHFASLRDREREIVILRSDDGQHWKEHQLEATEDAVQEVLNESFDAEDLAQLDDLQTPRITRILTSDFPMYFAVVTRVRQEVHCVGPEGGVIISSVVPRVQAIFPDGSLTKTIKVSVQAQPVPQEMVTRLHGNRVAVSPIVTVEPRRRKFHKPITLCIPLPQSNNRGMLTQYSGQQGQEPPTLRLLCSITGGSAPAQWEDITGTTQLTFTGDEVSFTTTVSARFWLMDCQTPRDAARMAQEVYNEAISIPYMAKFAVFARRTFPVEGQLRVFCMTDDKEDKTLEKQEHFKLIAKSRDVEVLKGKHQFLEFSGNLVPITKSGDQLSLFFLPFQENRLAFMVKTRSNDDNEAATEGRIGFMAEPKIRSDALPPQQPICTLAISLPEYTGEIKTAPPPKKDLTPFEQRYGSALEKDLPEFVHQNVLKGIGADWPRLGRALEVPHRDIQHIRQNYPGQECKNTLKIWIHLKKEDANQDNLDQALRQIGRDDIVRSIAYGEPDALINYSQADSPSQKREPIRHFEEVPAATLVKREVRTEDLVTREPVQPTHHVEQATTVVQEPSYSAPVHHSPVPEEPEMEEEAPVAEMRTVVRTERHVHDSEDGPVVEERTITTTYEDDVAVNENIVDRTVPLNEDEQQKWEELNRLADESSPSPAQRSTIVAESTSEQVPEDVEQSVESESHREDDGTIVTTTVTTSHISESPSGSPTRRSVEPEEHRHSQHEDHEASGAEQHSGQDSGTTQKKETAEEGFTNEDGSVVVSKKMTRVVTTTRTTLPGEGEEPSAPDSPVESLGSVKDRIAKFEQFKTLPIDPSVSGPPPSAHTLQSEEYQEESGNVESAYDVETDRRDSERSLKSERSIPEIHTSPSEEQQSEHFESAEHTEDQGRDSGRSLKSDRSIPEVQFTESDSELEKHDLHEDSHLEPTVGIVITPHTPVPPEHPDDKEDIEDEQPQEPLEPSEPEHVAHAELKDTREYSDEELAQELSPSEEHVSTAEIKDIKSYSPTSSDDERSSQKGKVSPPIPQVRHAISPSVASEVLSSHDDELAAHFVAESFEKHDEGNVETIEQTPVYKGHHSPGQTSPIVSEHPHAQEYAESVTSHDEGDNLSLKSGHEPEIARHSVASVQEEDDDDDEKSELGDFAKKAGMIVGGVIAAPVALAAVGAKAAYDALNRDDDEEKLEGHEEKEVLTTQTTIMESPIRHEDIPSPHLEDVTPKVSHQEHPYEHVTETTTTVTRDYYEQPEDHREASPAPSSHVESERPISESPAVSEREPSHIATETTTTVTREYDQEPKADQSSARESVRDLVSEEHEHPACDSERLSEPAQSPEPVETHAESQFSNLVETTTTTAVTREFYDEDQEEQASSRATKERIEQSPVASERSIVSTEHRQSPTQESEQSLEPTSEKNVHTVTETTTVTRECFEEPIASELEHASREFEQGSNDFRRSVSPVDAQEQVDVPHSPAPSSHAESEQPVPESPHHIVETTTTTTVTREFQDEEYPRPESPAEIFPIPSSEQQSEEPHIVKETTTTTTVTRELYDEPEKGNVTFSPAPSSHAESERQVPESPVVSHQEYPHVVETTTTTNVTSNIYDDEDNVPSSEDPATQHFQQSETSVHRSHPDSVEESDGEGLGSKVLGFAKKAGMVAGGVVAAPVALAAVGAKAAYDAFEKDDEDDETSHSPESPVPEYQSEQYQDDSAQSSHTDFEHHMPESPIEHEKETEEFDHSHPESPVLSEKEREHQVTSETTTTTTVTREYNDEPEDEQEHQGPHSPAPSSHTEAEHPHIVETTTTTTVTREFQEEPEELEYKQEDNSRKSPSSHSQENLVTETTTTTTVTSEYYDEPEHFEEQETGKSSPAPSSHVESERQVLESPVASDPRHVMETTTTTTVTRQFHDDESERSDSPNRDVVEAQSIHSSNIESHQQFSEKDDDSQRGPSPVKSEDEPVKHESYKFETSTTETREFDRPELDSERLSEPAQSPMEVSPITTEENIVRPSSSVKSEYGSEGHVPSVIETKTTTTVTREFYDDDQDEHENQTQSEELRSSIPTEEEEHEGSHLFKETTTTTTVTREFYDEPENVEELQDPQFSPAPSSHVESGIHASESPVAQQQEIPQTREFHEDSPAAQYFHEEEYESHVLTEQAPLLTEQQHQPESGDESDGEGLGSKVLGFAKKAGMVAGGVVAAPVALAAVGAKAAYDALKKDDDEEDQEERESLLRQERSIDSPHASEQSQIEEEHERFEESPVPSEKHHVTETTTTTTVTREYFDEHEPLVSQEIEGEKGSPADSEKSLPHVVETTTTTTVTREFDKNDSESPVPSEKEQEPTTVSREVYETAEGDEPEHHYTETTTTTVTKEVIDDSQEMGDDDEPKQESPQVVETTTTTMTSREYDDNDDETRSEAGDSHITETTKTTTVVREFHGEQPEETEETDEVEELPPKIEEEDNVSEYSESSTSVSREVRPDEPHIIETTTTTTVTREYHNEPEETYDDQKDAAPISFSQEHQDDDSQASHDQHDRESPVESEKSVKHTTETTTTTTVTRQLYDDEASEIRGESPVATEEHEHVSSTKSDDESEQHVPSVIETTTTTTVTREFYDDQDELQREDHTQSEERRSSIPTEETEHEDSHLIKETTTTTTVTREFYDEPENVEKLQDSQFSLSPSSHVESEIYVPESPVAKQQEIPQTREFHEDSPAAQYFHEDEYEHQVPTEQAPLLTEQQHQPESGEESDGEGFGSKVLGFAKKAGMVAGGVVAAPVALAAVGAKAAYDALKKEDDEEDQEERESLIREERSFDSPHASEQSQIEKEHKRFEESPVPSEKHHDQSSALPQESVSQPIEKESRTFNDESEFGVKSDHYTEDDQESLKSPKESGEAFSQFTSEKEQDRSDSPIHSQKEDISQFQNESSPEDVKSEQPHDEEKPDLERQGSYSSGYSPKSPGGSITGLDEEKALSGVQEPEDRPENFAESHEKTEATSDENLFESDKYAPASPVPSEDSSNRVIETTTTTTVTREHFEPEDDHSYVVESQEYSSSGSPVPSEKSVDRVIETTTTTTVTREHFEAEDEIPTIVESSHDDQAASPVPSEEDVHEQIQTTTTTTTVTKEHFVPDDEIDSEHMNESDKYASGSPVPSEEDSSRVTETTTTTTVTREHFEPEDDHSPVVQTQEYSASESPVPSEKSVERVIETTTTTTVTREHFEDEDHILGQQGESDSQIPSESITSENMDRETSSSPVQSNRDEEFVLPAIAPYKQPTEYGRVDSHDAPASPAPSAESPIQAYKQEESQEAHSLEQFQQRSSVSHEDSPAAQYFHDNESDHDSPVPSDRAPLLTEQQHQPESGEESDGEGFGSKVLGFAKKAGMVAGGVVAAPVALAAVGAKAAYDALKKDDDEDENPDEQEKLLPKSPERQVLVNPVEPSDSEISEIELEYTSPSPTEKSESQCYTETVRTTTVTREYLDDPQSVTRSRSPSEHDISEQYAPESPVEQDPYVVEKTTTVIRQYHDEPPQEIEEQTIPEEVTVLREVYESPEGDEPEQHYIETKTTTTITKEVHVPVEEDVQISPVHSETSVSEKQLPADEQLDEPVTESTTTATVTRERYEEPEEVRPPSGSEADDESHAPKYMETTTTTTVTREYEVSEDEDEHQQSQVQRDESPAPSEDSVKHVIEKTTTTTVTEERYEPEDSHSPVPSEDDVHGFVKTTTTTTTVTHEHFEPEDPPSDEHVVESERYASGSPVPSEEDSSREIETTTTTTVTREHFELEDDQEHVVESQEYSASGSPVPSEKSVERVIETTTTNTVTREHFEHEDDIPTIVETSHDDPAASSVPSEEDVHGQIQTTTTTTTVTREHVVPDEEIDSGRMDELEKYSSESPVPSEEDSSRVIETTTTTTVSREHFEPEDDHSHVVESQEYSASGSPVPSEKSVERVIETTTTTTVTREHFDTEEDYIPSESRTSHDDGITDQHVPSQSPVPSEEDDHVTHEQIIRDDPIDEQIVESHEYKSESSIPSEQDSTHVIETVMSTPITSERYDPEVEKDVVESADDEIDSSTAQYYKSESPVQTEKSLLLAKQQQESGDESDGEGFGSKVLGFAKKAGMVAGGVVAAPVALAAVGAKAAYDALKKDDDEEDQEDKEPLIGGFHKDQDPISQDEPSAVDSETQEPGATFYEPEEEDKVITDSADSSVVQDEPKIVFPVDSTPEHHSNDREEFESIVKSEGPYIVESTDYAQTSAEEPRISSPVHSDAGDASSFKRPESVTGEDEKNAIPETSETDAPYVIDSEEYEFNNRDEQRISSPAHSDEEDENDAEVIDSEFYRHSQEQNNEEDPSIVESGEYISSGHGSPRPFEDSTTTTVLNVHHEPAAIPEPEVDEEELEQERSIIESEEYKTSSPLPPTSVTTVEHVEPAEIHKYRTTSPTIVTTVSSEHLDRNQEPYVVESEEYTRASPLGPERPESPSGSPLPREEDDSHVIESHEYTSSPVPSEDSVKHVIEKTTTTTVTEERYEPEDSHSPVPSEDDVHGFVKTTTTTTTVTHEHFEPEDHTSDEHVVESERYASGSPVPSEENSNRVTETTTTTTVTREHFEPEDDQEHVVESQEYSASGSPVPSEKSVEKVIETTTTTTVTREHFEHEDEIPTIVESSHDDQAASSVPSEEDVHGQIQTTTTTTTVTREHVVPDEEIDSGRMDELEKYSSESPVPPEEDSSRVIETTTTTTFIREHFEPEDDHSHVVGSQEYSASGSPVPSEKSVERVIETTTTTTVTSEHFEHEDEHAQLHDTVSSEKTSSSEPVEQTLEEADITEETHQRFSAEDEHQPTSTEKPVHGFMETTSTSHTASHVELEHRDDDDESGGEGFGSKVLGFAKKAGMVAGGVVAAPVALAAVGAKAAYDALKKDDDEEATYDLDREHGSYESAELQRPTQQVESRQEDSESEGSFVDHGEDSQHLPVQSTEAAFKLSSEDIAEQTAEKLVSEVFAPLDRTLIESEQYRASIESLNRRSPVEPKRSVEDLASEALQNVTKISFGHADESDDKHDGDNDGEWKVYDRHGEVLEEFSTQLTDDVIQEAEGDATTHIMMTQAEYSPRRSKFLKQESCQEISNEPEVDYYSDLQEKLNILAGEKNNLHALVEEEPSSSASDQLDVIHESDQEAHLEQEHQQEAAAQKEQDEKEEAAEYTATLLVDDVLQQVVQEINEEDDDKKTMTSTSYLTATEKDDQEYDTCVTSQDDTYESAQGWTSQDSEYTTATSQAPSRLSDSDAELTARDHDQERQETSTPQAILSPVDSDRHFTVQQDFEMPVIRAFDPDDFMQTTARSTPDVALQVTIEEEDESDDKLPISPSGILLPPKHDPGRPISPVPPRKSDGTMQKEGDHFVFVREEDTIAEPTPPPQPAEPEQLAEYEATKESEHQQITEGDVPQEEEETEMRRQETERIHSLAMEASSDLGNSESSRYSRQLSDLSSSAESHADTVIRVESERSGSSDSLEVVSVISAGKDAQMSEKSLTPEDPEKPTDSVQEHQQKDQEQAEAEDQREAEDLGFEVYDADTEEQNQQLEELETVEEEPEDSDSLNEGGNHSSGHSSVGVPADTLAMIGKYRHQSSDNLSLTSLQEFERLEKEVGARGDGSLTRSEIELLVAGRLNKSGEGSVSSLAEFERLEKEMTENQSPPEDVMMLSDIREESEAEDMSIRDDDEEDAEGSDTELKSRPVQEEDLRVITPIAPSPTDSLDHAVDAVQMQYLETSTDSLEPTFQEIEVEQRPESVEDTSLTEYEVIPRVMEASTTDSLDGTATIEKDSVLEGASQGIESTQSTHGLLSGDTMGTVVTDDDRDSLDGEMSSMLQSYPTTLTTFQTTVVGPDGSLQTISRRVETKVTDPLVSHVTFTGTESQERLDQLPDDEQFETVDTEGNVTRTTFHREHDQQQPHF